MKCAVCEQELLTPEQAVAEGLDHHLMRSPVDPGLCLGCWFAFVEVELFFFRAGIRRLMTGLQTQSVMRKLLDIARNEGF